MIYRRLAAVLPSLLAAATVTAQQIGTAVPEVHPKLTTQFCTKAAGCVTRQTALVTDALSRNLHVSGDPAVACDTKNQTLCPDPETCSRSCALEGVDYTGIGVQTSGSALTLDFFLNNGTGLKATSPRLYLLAEDGMNYELLKLNNQELTYDVDVSMLSCGMNGALYLTEMEASGARSEANPAGAQYGTGYCDAQCFTDPTFINGLANLNQSGSCCNEMDIWEANSAATALTPHTCSKTGSFLCAGEAECGRGTGVCDKPGCGINPFATGAKDFYGPGLAVDTTRPFTVVTQFIAADNTSAGALSEIRRLYIQDGEVIQNAGGPTGTTGVDAQAAGAGTITQDFCTAKNASDFLRLGGVQGMGESLARGMVLIFSLWNSPGDFMNWLDSGNNGPCSNTSGDPQLIMQNAPNTSIVFSNIRWGEIGSTFNSSGLTGADVVGASTATTAGSASHRALSSGFLVVLAAVFGYLLA